MRVLGFFRFRVYPFAPPNVAAATNETYSAVRAHSAGVGRVGRIGALAELAVVGEHGPSVGAAAAAAPGFGSGQHTLAHGPARAHSGPFSGHGRHHHPYTAAAHRHGHQPTNSSTNQPTFTPAHPPTNRHANRHARANGRAPVWSKNYAAKV